MKSKIFIFAVAAMMLTACGGKTGSEPKGPEGLLKGVFSVSASRKVQFSQGNLQYLPATQKWQLAKNQYDYVGVSNQDVSADYDGWIDLFGWGTSGWDNGGNQFMPTSHGEQNEYSPWASDGNYYGPKGKKDFTDDLTGEFANADWGIYNAISNGGKQPNLWRTLTAKEWEYLLYKRPGAIQLLALGSVEGLNGLFILPDEFDNNNIFCTLAMDEYKYRTYDNGTSYNNKYGDYSMFNSFTKAQFEELQKLGVVFLPASGYRFNGENSIRVTSLNSKGNYWTSTHGKKSEFRAMGMGNTSLDKFVATSVYVSKSTVGLMKDCDRSQGNAVRLVQDVVEAE